MGTPLHGAPAAAAALLLLLLCMAGAGAAAAAPSTPLPYAPICDRPASPNTAQCHAQVLTSRTATAGADARKSALRFTAIEDLAWDHGALPTSHRRGLRGRALSQSSPRGFGPRQLQQVYFGSASPRRCQVLACARILI